MQTVLGTLVCVAVVLLVAQAAATKDRRYVLAAGALVLSSVFVAASMVGKGGV